MGRFVTKTSKKTSPLGGSGFGKAKNVRVTQCHALHYSLIYIYSANKSVDRYLSPESGSNTTIFLPDFSGRLARITPAFKAAPEEMPTKMPSECGKTTRS